jgi:hypothetical protein
MKSLNVTLGLKMDIPTGMAQGAQVHFEAGMPDAKIVIK